ncbi:hypothetical protein INT44_000596 [Umbelopsis vinacea]|uniref:5'-3' exoribonuclease 1 n=1 Tax=Umbelopsis vinacea TaxID=44442 RepID=A0A8H7QAK6_9FUNG|nr:hypothetical protein INT44_000596 [Umbelopsis vinacea]
MGVPKFFRWMSERYPLCSQLITENRIPEFDNLYLDMNGIIHNCSHNNSDDAHFRISEEQIWLAIFNYVDHLFRKIKPRKTFFLAIDGVAPRAKMNQQRSRRFRTAKDAEDLKRRALAKGEDLPDEPPFDSNCITPGTEFMIKLTKELQYFINKKVSEDANWRGIDIILSGPEVPGEGEHKIMDFIRLSKAQPDYNPNTRHCLYGLDADLVMLGLLSHDPHFALLREEVVFGRQAQKAKKTLPNSTWSIFHSVDLQNFYLMHLSLLREYLDIEFQSLKETLTFEYDLERIIDDFILLALFVGNDFLPHLPNLHIAEGALSLMFNLYKLVLPVMGGYINDGGKVDMKKLEILLGRLAEKFESDLFESEMADANFLRGKQEQGFTEEELISRMERAKLDTGSRKKPNKKKLVITKRQQGILQQIKEFSLNRRGHEIPALHFPSHLKAGDRHFVETVATDLGLHYAVEYEGDGDTRHVYIDFPENEEGEEDETEDEEDLDARQRVLAKYEAAEVIEDVVTEEQRDLQESQRKEEIMHDWKVNYYGPKMNIDYDTKEQMDQLVRSYIEGIQWVLYYYYNGVASWGWFYPYHYAPMISDLKDLDRFSNLEFALGKPFKAYEQLMGVLPSLSRKLLPAAYRDLMTDPTSPIIDFYPTDFELDMNGKKQDWEAIVKIPFIDEERLLSAMKSREHRLTKDEASMERIGQNHRIYYDANLENTQDENGNGTLYPSPLPGVFPDIHNCLAKQVDYVLPSLDGGLKLRKTLLKETNVGISALAGFPTLHTIPHTGFLVHHNVNVFQQESKNESVVVNLQNMWEGMDTQEIAKRVVGKRLFVGYPFLQESFVQAVSDEKFKYEHTMRDRKRLVLRTPMPANEVDWWRKRSDRFEYMASKRFACIIGHVDVCVHVRLLKGMRRMDDGALLKDYDHPNQATILPLQTSVLKVENEDRRYIEQPSRPVEEDFPTKSDVFFLGAKFYGTLATVIGHAEDTVALKLLVPNDEPYLTEPTFGRDIISEHKTRWIPAYVVAKKIGVSSLALSKITSSLSVQMSPDKVNLGLNLKFEAKQQKVVGYTRKTNNVWEYSPKAVDLLIEYKKQFPDFFRQLDKQAQQGEIYQPKQFYPEAEAMKKMIEIKQWLKSKGIADLPRVALDVDRLDSEIVQQIEQEAIKYNEVWENLEFRRVIVKNIPRHVLLKPAHAPYKLQNQAFELGDRVVFAQDSGGVPLGLRGTVIGFEDKHVQVVFDQTFMGGTTMGGQCSPFRGMTVPAFSVINLSQPAFLKTAPRPMKPHRSNNQ